MGFRFGIGLTAIALTLTLGLAPAPAAAQQEAATHAAMAIAPHGSFAGVDGHKAGGSYTVRTEGGATSLALSEDFSVDKGPDVYVVLTQSTGAPGADAVVLGRITKYSGSQTFNVPAGTDLSRFSTVLLWCKKYSVALGSAELASHDGMMHK